MGKNENSPRSNGGAGRNRKKSSKRLKGPWENKNPHEKKKRLKGGEKEKRTLARPNGGTGGKKHRGSQGEETPTGKNGVNYFTQEGGAERERGQTPASKTILYTLRREGGGGRENGVKRGVPKVKKRKLG